MDAINWYEFLCHTNYSFNTAASTPEEIIKQAEKLNYKSVGICDYDGVYGIIQAYKAKKNLNLDIKITYGAELHLSLDQDKPIIYQDTIVLKVMNYNGYQQLNDVITEACKNGKDKKHISLNVLSGKNTSDLVCIMPMRGIIRTGDYEQILERIYTLKNIFRDRLYIHASCHLNSYEDQYISRVEKLSNICSIPILVSQDIYFHDKSRKELNDIQHGIRLNKACYKIPEHLFVNSERSMASLDVLEKRYKEFSFFRQAMSNAEKLSKTLNFCPSMIRYNYPKEMIPNQFTSMEYLKQLVYISLKNIYSDKVPSNMLETIYKEMKLIEKLGFADYFLTVWDIVRWSKSQGILCQGRGSAANSAVCYILGITAINPVDYDLLFERFINVERGDPPDIDVDFENERREEVIQYIFQRYGRHKAAMVANIITYRSKSAIRDTAKALSISDNISGLVARDGDFTHCTSKIRDTWKMHAETIEGFPNHLGIHSGGFVICDDSLSQLSPVEPASMQDRTVIQWSKDDLEYIECFKIDVLALGMLTALRKTLHYLNTYEGIKLQLNQIPHADKSTYEMIQRADTLGTFQIESRAQMSMLVKLKPKCFYDLVVQVGIVRPGPIQGGLIHPFLKRKKGIEPIDYPHEKLIPILKRTMGIPIFQEQVMRVAMSVGEFSPGEADQIRKQIGSWSLNKDMTKLVEKLKIGMKNHGISQVHINQMVSYLKGFASYGFPESHAASFALIAYISAYLKCHYSVYFYTALLNTQPMGFYNSHTILNAARKDKIGILPVCVNNSIWDHSVIKSDGKYFIRLGLRLVKGLLKKDADKIVDKRYDKFKNFKIFLNTCKLYRNSLSALAASGAFSDFGLSRRSALWLCEGVPYAQLLDPLDVRKFKSEHPVEKMTNDFASTSTSLVNHPCTVIKNSAWLYDISLNQIKSSKDFLSLIPNTVIHCFGHIIIKQSPYTAKGMVFITMEDEGGFINLVFTPHIYKMFQKEISNQNFLCIEGRIQNQDGYHSVLVKKVISPTYRNIDYMEMKRYKKQKYTNSYSSNKLLKIRNFR